MCVCAMSECAKVKPTATDCFVLGGEAKHWVLSPQILATKLPTILYS